MAAGDEDDDKQYEPTQKKLDDARARGEIAKSNDLITAAAYGGFLIVALSIGPGALIGLGSALSILLDRADSFARVSFDGPPNPLMGTALRETVLQILPWFAGPMVMVVLAVLGQRALVFAPSKLAPKGSRISPISGFKNKFGREGLFEFLKSFAKLCLYGTVLGVFLSNQLDRIVHTILLTPALIAAELGRLCLSMMMIVLAIALALGSIDFLWQRAQHIRKNRMSRKEMMDELKQSEGDPLMKQQRRQKAIDLATNQMLAEVPSADVVIVNPTHFAVALSWSRLPGAAPVCVAKGVDELAATIREIAMENAVPIHSDPPTARALHASTDLGEEIASEFYRPVAAAIRFAEDMRKRQRFGAK